MIRQKLISRINALENTTGVCIEPKTIEVVFIEPDGTRSKTPELVFKLGNAVMTHPKREKKSSMIACRG
jgi:hypothetical protein